MGEQTSPPPGWYPDPAHSGQRYWDGNQWTAPSDEAASGVKTGGSVKRLLVTVVGTAGGILLALFVVIAFALHACDSAYLESKKAPVVVPIVDLGTNFDVAGVAVSNMQVSARHDLGSDGFMDASAKGIFIVVTAHVTNNGTKTHGLDSMFQKLYIGEKEYQANPFANIGTSSSMKTSVSVDPGFSDDVTFIFDVPQTSVTVGATTSSFVEKAVLNVSGGLNDDEKPDQVNVVLHN